MTAPHLAQGMPANESWFAEELRSLQRQISELRAAQTLNAATVGPGGISSSNFDGTLNPPTVGTAGWGMAGGPNGTAIVGDILLRGNIIGNDALTNPIAGGNLDGTALGLTLTTTNTALKTGAITVPNGFSSAFVLATGAVGGSNLTGSNDGVTCSINVAGTAGDQTVESLPSAQTAHAYASFATTVTGLVSDGTGTLSIATWGHSSTASFTGMTARLSALVIFLR